MVLHSLLQYQLRLHKQLGTRLDLLHRTKGATAHPCDDIDATFAFSSMQVT